MTKELTKLSLTSFNPKQTAGFADGSTEMYLGRLAGQANGIKNALAQDGVTPMYGVKGVFGALYPVFNNKDGEVTEREDERAGVLYLPESFMNPILDLFRGVPETTDDDGKVTKWKTEPVRSVDVAYDVFAIKASNPAGYSWSLRPLIEPEAANPLAAIMARLPEFNQKGQLAIVGDKKPAIEAPKKK